MYLMPTRETLQDVISPPRLTVLDRIGTSIRQKQYLQPFRHPNLSGCFATNEKAYSENLAVSHYHIQIFGGIPRHRLNPFPLLGLDDREPIVLRPPKEQRDHGPLRRFSSV